jgi:Kef-type K+ transport system membrane component KefB
MSSVPPLGHHGRVGIGGLLAGPNLAGPNLAAVHLTGHGILVALIGVAVVAGLLWMPVLGDRLTDTVSRHAPRVFPPMLLLGLALLVLGLVVHVGILDVVGGCLAGVVVLAVIVDNY